jgi:hypothetical protein
MLACIRRSLLVTISLAASAAPLAAQFFGSVRTFESTIGCYGGPIEYTSLTWPTIPDAYGPIPTTRVGTAFCSQARVTIGKIANAHFGARVDLDVTVPEPQLVVTPYVEVAYWLRLNVGMAGAPLSPYLTTPLTEIGPIDFTLDFDRRLGLYDMTPTGMYVAGQWEMIGNPGRWYDRTPMFGSGYTQLALIETTVPEPSTWALMATGLLTIGGAAMRRKRRTGMQPQG